jgi:hypothetical protein
MPINPNCGKPGLPACPPVDGALPGEKKYSLADMLVYAAKTAEWALDEAEDGRTEEARQWIAEVLTAEYGADAAPPAE